MSFERVVVLASASRRKIYQLDIDFRGNFQQTAMSVSIVSFVFLITFGELKMLKVKNTKCRLLRGVRLFYSKLRKKWSHNRHKCSIK